MVKPLLASLRSITSCLPILILVCLPPSALANDLGRLFYTPAERAQLNQLRRSGETIFLPDQTDATALETITLNGILQRRDGTLHSWINGIPSYSETPLPARLGRQTDENRALPMELPGGMTVRPKPGQWIDLKRGQLFENYEKPAIEKTEQLADDWQTSTAP
ncbi:MAG TPA: hypothetical protein DCF45_12830 [Gammaproteobacteria bacterium]|nr:hypothetical protein [Gammaproteobacteria bacterium]